VFVALALAGETNVNLMKAVDLRPRPNGDLWGGIGSFPSGHTAYAAVLGVTAGALFHRTWVWVCGFAFIAAMALSRTVVGAHWLTDTLAGAACGSALAVLVWALASPHPPASSDVRNAKEEGPPRRVPSS
jgi:undecaprenyl-diphosphatase